MTPSVSSGLRLAESRPGRSCVGVVVTLEVVLSFKFPRDMAEKNQSLILGPVNLFFPYLVLIAGNLRTCALLRS